MTHLSIKQRVALGLHRQLIKEQQEKHPLRQLFWECTLRCNLRCRHCGSDCHVSSSVPDMPFEDFRKVLRRVREVWDPHRIMIVITGGEPLMRKDLEKCGRAIYDMEFPWGLVSNGLLMTPRRNASKHLLIAFASDRGLCGSYNAAVVKETLRRVRELQAQGRE